MFSSFHKVNLTMTKILIVEPSCFNGLIRGLLNVVRNIPDATYEIMIVENHSNWWRMFWNPSIHQWQVSYHDSSGWLTPKNMNTSKLISIIETPLVSQTLLNAVGVQYRNTVNTLIWKSTK
jgi:hypothetical protein